MQKIYLIIIILTLMILISVVLYWMIFIPVETISDREIIFSLEKGQGSKDIALNLEKENLIKSANFFRFYVLLNGTAGYLKAGDYILSPAMNVPEISDKFFRGEVVKKTITIIEGWNLRQIASYFEKQELFEQENFWQTVNQDFSGQFIFLQDKPKNTDLEGYLFPDTYEVRKDESLEQIILKMLDNFDKKLNSSLKEEIEKQGKSNFDIIIMASLLEKEVRTFEDKQIVSGIFWKKIEAGEALYSCATIAYILGREDWSFDEMRKEIGSARDIDSPYNTYRHSGLTPGPICNPGLESIKAAVYPQETDYWHFLSLPDGETIFSRNLKEHNAFKAEYFLP